MHYPACITKYFALFLLLVGLSLPAQAEQIDLECRDLARQMVSQLIKEGLVRNTAQTAQHAEAITMSLCADAEASAQQQHEEGKQQAIYDWIWQKRPETRGHKRLKKF